MKKKVRKSEKRNFCLRLRTFGSLSSYGKYEVIYFSGDSSISNCGVDVVFFTLNEELRRNVEGNNYFASDGYLYDGFSISGTFRYIPQVLNETQILEVDNLRNLNLKSLFLFSIAN